MIKYTYLLIDLGSIIVPFIFSFHPKLRFDKEWKSFWPSAIVSAFIFIIWDIKYTEIGVWGFNPDYLSGLYFFNLPIEEVLFFICIPYACLFTYHCFHVLLRNDIWKKLENGIFYALIVFLIITAIFSFFKYYTSVTFITLSLFIIFLKYGLKVEWLNRFFHMYFIILLPFFIVNGMLTGTGLNEPIVWYNDAENLGIRMLTIPVEDTFYGMLLILLNVSIYEYIKKRNSLSKVKKES